MRRVPHVAVLVESSRAFGRALLQGIAQYTHERGPWSMYFEPHGLEAPPPKWLSRWQGDGILARFDSRRMLSTVKSTHLPAVDLRGRFGAVPFPLVSVDNAMVVRLVVDHFWDAGLRSFAYCGQPAGRNRVLDLRGRAFAGDLRERGCQCEFFAGAGLGPQSSPAERDWDGEQEQIATWLRTLPKPVGVLACNDDRAFQVLDACRRAEIAVPDEVSVVGVDNDPVVCELADPPLSSVDPDAARIGYEAAACLDQMMQGRKPRAAPLLIEPRGLLVRQSSDLLSASDPDYAKALRYLREHACDGINVEDVLKETSVCRTVLERKFKQHLGRTPKAEILRLQLERAAELLASSDLCLQEVAERSGFSCDKYFSDAFYHHVGMRPGAFRKQHRHA